jgi:Arginase/agmatinase/formimionoglutamate hydrolase, arginase family
MLKKSGIKLITSFDFKIKTIKQLSTFIRKNILRNAYISIDVDVADPAFAPGVNVPSPGGLSSLELLFLARASAEIANLGFDVMEISPPYDLNNITSLLGIKLIQEMIVSFNLKNNIYK